MFRTPAKDKRPPTRFEDVEFESSPGTSISLSPSPKPKPKPEQRKGAVSLKFSPPPNKVMQAVSGPSKAPTVVNKTFTKRTPPEITKKQAADMAMHNKRFERLSEAKDLLQKATEHLDNSRNLKTEIKQGVAYAVKRIYALMCQTETDLSDALIKLDEAGKGPGETKKVMKDVQTQATMQDPVQSRPPMGEEDREELRRKWDILAERMDEHSRLLKKNLESTNNLEQVILKNREVSVECVPPKSYARAVSEGSGARPQTHRTLYSVAITEESGLSTADETLKGIRMALNAKEGGVEVERVRKAKDGKVIVSCKSEEERDKLKDKLKKVRADLVAENITNKRPMVMITGVLKAHTDDDLHRALRNQNKAVFEGLGEEDDLMEIAYKIRGRNPNTHRVVFKVSPALWRRLTEVGMVRIDLQNLHVTDRSPLTQCTICLGFGHGKKLCTETQVMCSHCGGPHTRKECEEYAVDAPPKCKNCVKEKRAEAGHNAFSEACPVRKRWDNIVRSTVAYS